MNLLVCFKIVKDLDSVMENDWNKASANSLDISYANSIINLYDEGALEAALRLADEAETLGRQVTITAVTLGSGNQEFFFRNLFAVGIDRIVQIICEDDLRFTPNQVSSLLCSFISSEKFDAILMGQKSSIGDNGQTPLITAQFLGLPCITQVIEMSLVNEGIRVEHQIDGAIRRATVTIPSVYAFCNSRHPYLRVATLREKLATSKCHAQTLDSRELKTMQLLPPDPILIQIYRQKSPKNCVFLQRETPVENARELYEHYLLE
jgi:electron transfer flavoprotein beta subunit